MRESEIPAEVFIGAKRYTIHSTQDKWNRVVAEDPEGMYDKWATSDHFSLEINLKPGQADAEMQDTLLHEVLHCIWAQGQDIGLMEGKVDEEYLVARQSPWLLMVLQFNPDLVSYLMPPNVRLAY